MQPFRFKFNETFWLRKVFLSFFDILAVDGLSGTSVESDTLMYFLLIYYNIVITFSKIFVYLIMIKSLTTIGNSKAVIIPAELIKKYGLEKVLIEETEEGILIKSVTAKSSFQDAVEKLRKNKTYLYKKMESEANEPETIAYYKKQAKGLSEIDLDIIQE